MVYVDVPREKYGRQTYYYYECELCGEKIEGRTHAVVDDCLLHLLKNHKSEYGNIVDQGGESGMCHFKETLKSKRMWKCPKCGELMSPHERYYHDNNAGRTTCIKEEKAI